MNVFRLGGGEAYWTNNRTNLLNGKFDHVIGIVCTLKQDGCHLIDSGIGGLGREQNRDEQGVGVFVVQWDGSFREVMFERIDDKLDFIGLLHDAKLMIAHGRMQHSK